MTVRERRLNHVSGESTLMRLHCRNQRLRGHFEKFFVEAPAQCCGPLDQPRHLIEKIIGKRDGLTLVSQGGDLLSDQLTSLSGVTQYACRS